MSKWQEDPELFIYKDYGKGNALRIWRCKKMSSSMPLTPDDFTDETPVSSELSQQSPSETLEKYIAPMRFLVNCQGLVYLELHKNNKDGKMDSSSPPIYLRLLDVLNMEVFDLMAAPIPHRKLGYLNSNMTVGVRPNPSEMKLTAEVEQQKPKVTEEEMNEKMITALQEELDKEMNCRKEDERKVAELEAELKEFREAKEKETWMNDCKSSSDWVTYRDLKPKFNTHGQILKVLPLRRSSDDKSTNIHARHFYLTFTSDGKPWSATLVNVNDLTNGEKAKFKPSVWGTMENDGITYAAKFT